MKKYLKAKYIFDNSKTYDFADGERLVETLVGDSCADELSKEELNLLCRGYNWAGKDTEALSASRILIGRFPDDEEILHQHVLYMWNCYCQNIEVLIEKFEENIASKIGDPVFWYLCIAEQLIDLAYIKEDEQDYEWYEWRSILKPEYLEKAASYIDKSISMIPELLLGNHPYDLNDCSWNKRFEGLLHHDKFAKFRRG